MKSTFCTSKIITVIRIFSFCILLCKQGQSIIVGSIYRFSVKKCVDFVTHVAINRLMPVRAVINCSHTPDVSPWWPGLMQPDICQCFTYTYTDKT